MLWIRMTRPKMTKNSGVCLSLYDDEATFDDEHNVTESFENRFG